VDFEVGQFIKSIKPEESIDETYEKSADLAEFFTTSR
jgi:hypothetical protein